MINIVGFRSVFGYNYPFLVDSGVNALWNNLTAKLSSWQDDSHEELSHINLIMATDQRK